MEHGTWNMEHGTCNMEHGTWNMEHGTWNMQKRPNQAEDPDTVDDPD
jgi:hypothetical protein